MALVLAEKETQFQNQVHNFYFYIFCAVERKKKRNQLKLRSRRAAATTLGRRSVATCNLNGIFKLV